MSLTRRPDDPRPRTACDRPGCAASEPQRGHLPHRWATAAGLHCCHRAACRLWLKVYCAENGIDEPETLRHP